MSQTKTNRQAVIALISHAALSITVLATLAGCGGGGGGLGLSGGSIPGGGTITGKLALPSGGTLTSATTTAANLSTSAAIDISTTIDGSGNFTITKAPVATDIDLTFVSGSVTLKAIVPSGQVSATHSVNIGKVDASTTVTADAIETEIADGIDDPATIVSTQFAVCTSNQANAGETVAQQNADITDPTARHNSAERLIVASADSEMGEVNGKPTIASATAAYVGVLSYITSTGGTVTTLTDTQRTGLINAQAAKKHYSVSQVSAALATAGVVTDNGTVAADENIQRKSVPSFANFGGTSPMEAVAVGACPTTAGGFGLTGAQLSTYVDAVLSN